MDGWLNIGIVYKGVLHGTRINIINVFVANLLIKIDTIMKHLQILPTSVHRMGF